MYDVIVTRYGHHILRLFGQKSHWSDRTPYNDGRQLVDLRAGTHSLGAEILAVLAAHRPPYAPSPSQLYAAFAQRVTEATGITYPDDVLIPIWEQFGREKLVRVRKTLSPGTHVAFIVPDVEAHRPAPDQTVRGADNDPVV